MSDFKAQMHQIRFWLGLCPDPTGEAYSAHPTLIPTRHTLVTLSLQVVVLTGVVLSPPLYEGAMDG